MANELTKKLFLHKAHQALFLNQPEGYGDILTGALPDNVMSLAEPTDETDFVLLFAKDSQELSRLFTQAVRSAKPDGYLWVAYPKKSSKLKSDLNRDSLQAQLREGGHEGVSLISLDDTWSAMRIKKMQ